MGSKKTSIELQYSGYLNTPCLWENTPLLGLEQLDTSIVQYKPYKHITNLNQRLGHRVEQFVFHELSDAVDIVAQNIQIKDAKRTIGEIDCILTHDDSPIHLEVIYKFYLYDESVGHSELEHWIGPNRNDSLIEKITKLKQKQLPLLYKPETASLLKKLNFNVSDIKQQVYFKAQLFVPHALHGIPLRQINNACIAGVYITYTVLDTLSQYQFYLPQKLDWLTEVHTDVNWQTFEDAKPFISTLILKQKSPLCWLKSPEGDLQKLFVIWW